MKKGWWGFWGYVLGNLQAEQAAKTAYEQGLRDARRNVYIQEDTVEIEDDLNIPPVVILFGTVSYWFFLLGIRKATSELVASRKDNSCNRSEFIRFVRISRIINCPD